MEPYRKSIKKKLNLGGVYVGIPPCARIPCISRCLNSPALSPAFCWIANTLFQSKVGGFSARWIASYSRSLAACLASTSHSAPSSAGHSASLLASLHTGGERIAWHTMPTSRCVLWCVIIHWAIKSRTTCGSFRHSITRKHIDLNSCSLNGWYTKTAAWGPLAGTPSTASTAWVAGTIHRGRGRRFPSYFAFPHTNVIIILTRDRGIYGLIGSPSWWVKQLILCSWLR